MKITIEFKDVQEYLEFKERTAQDKNTMGIEQLSNNIHNYLHKTLDKTSCK